MCITGFTLVVLVCFLPETSSNSILYYRARRLRTLTSNENIKSQAEISGIEMSLLRSIHFNVNQAFSLAFFEPIILFLNLYSALTYGLLYVWFESFAIVFVDIYHFSLSTEGLSFLGILIGGIIVVPMYLLHYRLKVEPHFFKGGQLKPEIFLPPACVGAFAVPICLFWFGWTARASVHWILPIVGSGFYTVGVVLLFNPVFNYMGVTYPKYAASVFAGNAFARATFGGAFPLFVSFFG
jgi:DHA1 family multidrug resistance protein-like MFS transporter